MFGTALHQFAGKHAEWEGHTQERQETKGPLPAAATYHLHL